MKLLIDADFIVYKSCAAAEVDIDYGDDVIVVSSNFSDALKNVHREIGRIRDQFAYFDAFGDVELTLYFSSSENFRKKIMPDYKGHRNRKKPCGYRRVIHELASDYHLDRIDGLEADDAIGIAATTLREQGEMYSVVSPDKDLRQIPGMLYDFKEISEVTPEEGRKFHLLQTLAGDNTDGYNGVSGFGMKKAYNYLEEKGYTWKAVLEAFGDEEEALRNARLAKILTKDDFDSEQLVPILWSPAADYRADSGAEFQDEALGDAA